MVPKKRHYQSSSIIDHAKQSPSLEHLKRMRLVGEHTVQNDEKGVEEWNTSKEDASTVCKLDASGSISLKSECDSHAQNERSHIIMRNFSRVIWNVLKQYNSKLKVAEMEILNLKESIEYEKKKNLELEIQMNEFRACCTCCKGGKVKTSTEDCSSVDLDHPRNLDQEEMFHAQSSSEPRLDQSDEEHMLGTACTELDSEISDREVLVSSSKPGHHNALQVDAVSKIPSETFHAQSSSEARLDLSEEGLMLGSSSCTQIDSEKSDREVSVSSSKTGLHSALEVDVASKIPSESFHAQTSSEPRFDLSDEELVLGKTCTELDSEKSNREFSVSSSKTGHNNALEVDVVSKIPSETFHAQSSSETILDLSNDEPMLGTSCTQLDSEKSDSLVRGVSASSSKPWDHNAPEVDSMSKIPSELFVSSSLAKDDILDPSSPKDVSSTKTHNLVGDPRGDVGVNNSCKPPKPKRTLVPSSSMLSRDLSTFDLFDESEKLKGNRSTRKLAATAHDSKRSNGSISLLHLLQGRKGNHRL